MTNPEKVSIPYTEWERLRLMENRCDHLEYVLRRIADWPGTNTDEYETEPLRDFAREALSTKGDE